MDMVHLLPGGDAMKTCSTCRIAKATADFYADKQRMLDSGGTMDDAGLAAKADTRTVKRWLDERKAKG